MLFSLLSIQISFPHMRIYSACLNKQHRPRLHSIPRAPAPEVAAFLAHETREHHVVHFGRAIDEARLPRVAIDPFQNRVLGIAARAVELNRDVCRPMQRIGDVHLGHGDFLARAITLVELPGRVHHQQPPDLDLMRHLAELDLHALAIAEPHPEAFAVGHIGLRDLHRALGESEPAHAMGEPRGPKPDLGDAQSVADLHQHVLVGHLEPFEDELAVAAVLLRPHDRNAAQDAPARLVAVIEEGAEPAPGAGSVMAKEERTLPSTIGLSHLFFCAGVPTRASRFMLPSSGAAQLNASGPKIERFASSYIAAQPTIGSSMPPYSFGACGAHRPSALALACTPRSTSRRMFS